MTLVQVVHVPDDGSQRRGQPVVVDDPREVRGPQPPVGHLL